MGEIVSRGAKLHFQKLGDGDRETVVFVHGLVMDNLASFYFSVANAVSQEFDVLLYDLRGHGKSQRMRDGYTVAGMVEDLLAIIRENGSKRAHLVGNSFGGVVAVSFALAHPALVKSIVLIDAHLGDSSFAEQMADTLSLEGEARDMKIAEGFQHWLGRHSERKRNRLAEHAQDLVARTTLVADMRATPPLSEDDLRKIDAPILAVYGEGSDLRERSTQLLKAAPRATVKVFEGCSHAILWEATARLREEMAIFLEQNSDGENR
ncbi:MAG: alpha/beta fold hydrolase [Polyangiaceae bacterium]